MYNKKSLLANANGSSCPYNIASLQATSKTKTVNLDRVHRRRGSGDHGKCLERSVLHAGRAEQERTR
jgi:hypothetical protein